MALNIAAGRQHINIDVIGDCCESFIDAALPRCEAVTSACHIEYVIRLCRQTIQFVDAVVSEVRHRAMRPPVPVIVARLGTGETHRLPAVDEQHRVFPAHRTKIVRRCDAGDAGTDDDYFDVLFSFCVN